MKSFNQLTLLVLSLSSLAVATPAFACSFVSPFDEGFEVIGGEAPAEAPAPPDVSLEIISITRGQGPEGYFEQSATSCDDTGILIVQIVGFDANFGYHIEARGDVPEGMWIPDGPVRVTDPNGSLTMVWSDGATDDQETIDFELVITALDQYGNAGAESEPLRIFDEGSSGGCSTTRASEPSLIVIALFGLVALRRRRA